MPTGSKKHSAHRADHYNNTKRKKRKTSRADRRMTWIGVGFLLFCVMSFGAIRLFNGRTAVPQDSWYVENAEMEILAPEAGTAEQRPGGSGETLPFMQPTPTPAPSPEPTVDPYSVITAPVDATRAPVRSPAPTNTPVPAETIGAAVLPTATPEPEERGETEILLTCVGDCTLGGDIPTGAYKNFASYAQRYGLDYFLENVRDLFEADDLTIVNLEGPLTTSTEMRSGRAFNFRGYPEYVKILSGSGVEIANVANNHALDFGKAGLEETRDVLEGAGIGVSGFSYVYTADVKGVRVRSIGFTEWDYSREQIVKSVRDARDGCDLLIVSMHWGKEKVYEATSTQQRLGRAIIDAGADLVVGSHPHVYGGIEMYKGKYIVYSMGNFCFGGHKNPDEHNCIVFQQSFVIAPDGSVSDGGVNIIPALISSSDKLNNFQPKLLTGDAAAAQLKRIYSLSSVEPEEVRWLPVSRQVSAASA